MTLHWMHVTAAWALVALGFAGMAGQAALRHRSAKRRLAVLDPRGNEA
ncbi:hypothetical protein C8P66_11011 [Humitalea rosea]|uniref:Heme exporter protein D n=1 Tax=Humitalea rosea TaxID=990373 RepID=A0A2W7IGN6_9PROT|nr:hypothetical protein [Humitalea rosea]PZW45814.1 hypothetical protein C8P66_11011 [Humitalea rosea]